MNFGCMSEFLATRVLSLRQVFSVMVGVMVMVIASHLSLDNLGPVPFTFQNAGVHILALTLPPGRAALSILLWITWGILGAPVFALFHSGAEKICGVTGGYFIGMLLAAPLMSLCQFRWAKFWNSLCSRKQNSDESLNFLASIAVGIMGSMVILFCGWAYLGWMRGYAFAFKHGVVLFLLPSVLKIVLSSLIIKRFNISKIGL